MARRIDLNYNTHFIHGQNDGMKLHYPLMVYPESAFELITYIMTISGYWITYQKPRRKSIP
jgi:hypothetical protein